MQPRGDADVSGALRTPPPGSQQGREHERRDQGTRADQRSERRQPAVHSRRQHWIVAPAEAGQRHQGKRARRNRRDQHGHGKGRQRLRSRARGAVQRTATLGTRQVLAHVPAAGAVLLAAAPTDRTEGRGSRRTGGGGSDSPLHNWERSKPQAASNASTQTGRSRWSCSV